MEGSAFNDLVLIRGGRPLEGSVDVRGSKNAALAILSSVMLADGKILLRNVPRVSDVEIKRSLIAQFGAVSEWIDGDMLALDCRDVRHAEPSEADVRPIRTSFYLLGPLLARVGRARLPMPGGCKIGARPVDLHLKGLNLMGAKIKLEGGVYNAYAEGLRGAEIYLDSPSAGATQHLMATACLADGHTVIQNAALEPEVVALASFLNCMGAKIEGAGTSTITVEGGRRPLADCEFRVPSDRLQAGTYLVAGAMTRGDITTNGILPEDQAALLNKLRECGAQVSEGHDWVRVKMSRRPIAAKIKTMPYPGFATDMQQPMAALLSIAEGRSVVEETIYESRIGHVQELNRMGARLTTEGRAVLIDGVPKLAGAAVEATDLRAGAALVLAGLAAEGETQIRNVHFIDRGYQEFFETLTAMGADVSRSDAMV